MSYDAICAEDDLYGLARQSETESVTPSEIECEPDPGRVLVLIGPFLQGRYLGSLV